MWWLTYSAQSPYAMHHHLEVTGLDLPDGEIDVGGICSCGAEFSLFVGAPVHEFADLGKWGIGVVVASLRPRFLGSYSHNSYPPCPAVAACAREYEKECRK